MKSYEKCVNKTEVNRWAREIKTNNFQVKLLKSENERK